MLADLQRDFQRHVLSRYNSDFVDRSVIGTPAAESTERVGVYHFAYRARLVEILGNDFHGLRALMGDAEFNAASLAYVDATHSKHYNVRWYGQRLTAFLADVAPWSANPALAEMAGLEWSLGTSFDAADDSFVESHALESIAPEQWPLLRLRLHASVQKLELAFNTGSIRRAVDRSEAIPQIQKLDKPQTWVVSRRDTAIRYRLAPADECAALDAFAQGCTLAEVCEVLCEWHAEDAVAMRAAGLLKQWIYDQWVARLTFAQSPEG